MAYGALLARSQAALQGLHAFTQDRSGEIQGPFNESFCSECHSVPTPGGAQFLRDDFVVKQSQGGRARTYQRYTLVHGVVVFRNLPKRYYLRKPQPLYGIGLLEAVPVAELARIAAEQRRTAPQHQGRIPQLPDGGIGRFGWKAAFPSIDSFVSAAFRTELGIRRPRRAAAITAYLQLLAAPPLHAASPHTGRVLFQRIGCADCHRPVLHVASYGAVAQLNGVTIDPYTDLLLHDMGPADADVAEGAARASEFRTPPLWGVSRTGPPYMHDGRANSLEDAIALHGGQGADSAKLYGALSPDQRAVLLRFLRSL